MTTITRVTSLASLRAEIYRFVPTGRSVFEIGTRAQHDECDWLPGEAWQRSGVYRFAVDEGYLLDRLQQTPSEAYDAVVFLPGQPALDQLLPHAARIIAPNGRLALAAEALPGQSGEASARHYVDLLTALGFVDIIARPWLVKTGCYVVGRKPE